MRYRNLSEDVSFVEQVIARIEQDCQPYLSCNKTLYRGVAEDGIQKMVIQDTYDIGDRSLYINRTASTRVPTDADPRLTKAMNQIYKKIGSPVSRTEHVMFATREDTERASEFGDIYVVFPIGNFNALWNNKISDLVDVLSHYSPRGRRYYDISNDELNKLMPSLELKARESVAEQERWRSEDGKPPRDKEELNDALKKSLESHITAARKAGVIDVAAIYNDYKDSFFSDLKNDPLDIVEVMINVKSYYLVTLDFYEEYLVGSI